MNDDPTLPSAEQPTIVCERCDRTTKPGYRTHQQLWEPYTAPDGVVYWHAPRLAWLCDRCFADLDSTKPPWPGSITIEHYERMALRPRMKSGQPRRVEQVPEFAAFYRATRAVLHRRLGREPYEDELIEALAPAMWHGEDIDPKTFHRWLEDFNIPRPPARRQ